MNNSPEQVVILPLAAIIDIDAIPDRPLNIQHVDALVVTNEPDKWPPIIVTPIGEKYGRIAGKHRIEAARRLQLSGLRAVVRTYSSPAEMYSAMWEDNARNGLPPSTSQRKEYALTLHRLQPQLSLREIGRRAGLPHITVQRALDEMKRKAEETEEDKATRKLIAATEKLKAACNTYLNTMEDLTTEECAELLALACKDEALGELEELATEMKYIFAATVPAARKEIRQRKAGARVS